LLPSAFEPAIAPVDYTGGLAGGRLLRGHNPVLMTMELMLDRSESAGIGVGDALGRRA
jgi:hypothetical protein